MTQVEQLGSARAGSTSSLPVIAFAVCAGDSAETRILGASLAGLLRSSAALLLLSRAPRMDTRRATERDLERIRVFLEEAGLPALPSNLPLSNVVVALNGHEVLGGVALQVCALSGLLCSAVVSPEHQRTGIGSSLLQSIIARAHELGLRDLYLLTETASEFFSSAGFEGIDRSELPGEIRATPDYKQQGTESVVVMKLPLATRW